MIPRRIAITGASGLVGTALTAVLEARGDRVHPLVRGIPNPDSFEVNWSPDRGEIDIDALEGIAAFVHLAGEPIAGLRWTSAKKERIYRSRVAGTKIVAEALASLAAKPAVFVSASGINYYGDRGDAFVTEDEAPGPGFLGEVCRDWEKATEPASDAGIRTVIARTAMVLSGRGGALATMLPAFRLGVGGKLGSGAQYMSWLTLEDHVRALIHAIDTPTLSGPTNFAAPEPVTNAVFTRALGQALGRPAFMAVPAFAIRLAMGQMGRELLLESVRASSAKLIASGFTFHHPTIDDALRAVLGR